MPMNIRQMTLPNEGKYFASFGYHKSAFLRKVIDIDALIFFISFQNVLHLRVLLLVVGWLLLKDVRLLPIERN